MVCESSHFDFIVRCQISFNSGVSRFTHIFGELSSLTHRQSLSPKLWIAFTDIEIALWQVCF